ncbi:hypothetical protein L1887_31734 [Cichorium endivia]|nr:hypothetical protein L1887_31734 [Cichorium endivia]
MPLHHLRFLICGISSQFLGVKDVEVEWIGWVGVNVPDELGQRSLTKALAEKRCIPVFLDEETVHQYYNGYCKNILWPLFHYLGLPQDDRLATTRTFQSQFDGYKRANQMFADVVNFHYKVGDAVWCHNYHLMFLPKCLKDYNSNMKVGWFLHTPFPSFEIHRTLPSRSDLLLLIWWGRLTRVAAFPIGLDSARFVGALETPQVQEKIRELKERFFGRKAIDTSDALIKFVYTSVFSWLVETVNKSLKGDNVRSISILDIYGFESFQKNTFDQLLINYADERLQQHLVRHLFKIEQEEYESEG